MKYCSHCGAQLNDNDVFCVNCGTRYTDEPEPIKPEPAEEPAPVKPEPPEETADQDEIEETEPEEEDLEEEEQEYDEPEYGEPVREGFSAGRFFKTLILVILPIISAAMLFFNWTVFKGASSADVGAIISTCAGYTDNGVVNAMGDGGIAPSELSKIAGSISEIARFLSVSSSGESINLVANVFRVLALIFILSLAAAVVAVIFRAIRPLRKARNLDFGFFFLQILLFVSFLLINTRMNAYIKANGQGLFGGGLDLGMSMTAWSVIALICAIPSCIIDLIRFPGETRDRHGRRSALPVITAIGSVLLAGGIVFAAFSILTSAAPETSQSVSAETETPYEIILPESTAPATTAAPETTTEETTTQETTTAETTTPETSSEETTIPNGSADLPLELLQTIGSHLRMVTNAYPETVTQKIYAYTDNTLTTVDDSSYVDCFADELVIVDLSADGSAVAVKYPVGDGYKTKWFDRDDILGICYENPEKYTAVKDAFVYSISGEDTVKKIGYIEDGDECIILGTREFEGTVYELTIYPIGNRTVNEIDNIEYRIAWVEQGSQD